MKTTILFVAFLLVSSLAQAKDIPVSFTVHQDTYENESLDSGFGAELKLYTANEKYFIFGDVSVVDYKWAGQPLSTQTIFGIGLGLQREVAKGIRIYGQVGWYQPRTELMNSKDEALYFYVQDKLPGIYNQSPPFAWKHREFYVGGDVGGKIGFDVNQEITENLSLSFGASLRILELPHRTKWWDEAAVAENPDQIWLFDEDVNYGGYSLFMEIKYRF